MNITLQQITSNEEAMLKNMVQYFCYDFSEMNGADLEETGKYKEIKDIADYYSRSEYSAFFIRVNGKLAGIAVIRFEDGVNYFRHLGILRKYRGQKVGQTVCRMIFDKFGGKWRVSQYDYNKPAILFWRKVIDTYMNGQFEETRRADNKGPEQIFCISV